MIKSAIHIEEIISDFLPREGISQPVHIKGSDEKSYLLKSPYFLNPKTNELEYLNSVFFHEVLVYELAKYLDIEVPNYALVQINEQDFKRVALPRERYPVGLYFASEIIPNVNSNYILNSAVDDLDKPIRKQSWMSYFGDISNKESVANIIAMDLLVCNFDRFGNPDNLLISSQNDEKILYAIDHGFSFWGHIWINSKVQIMQMVCDSDEYLRVFLKRLMGSSGYYYPMSGLGEVFRALDQHVIFSQYSSHSFANVKQRIDLITPELFDTWINKVPLEFFVDRDTQIETYRTFLLNHKTILPKLIQYLADNGAFSNFLGKKIYS